MKARSVSDYLNKLLRVFGFGLICLISALLVIICLPLTRATAHTPMNATGFTSLLFAIIYIITENLFSTASSYEQKIKFTTEQMHWLKKRLAELNQLLDKPDDELTKEKIIISSISIGDIELLKAEITTANSAIDLVSIRKTLENEQQAILSRIKWHESGFRKKPKYYAFLEKHLRLAPVEI